jgi:hypothetical protein
MPAEKERRRVSHPGKFVRPTMQAIVGHGEVSEVVEQLTAEPRVALLSGAA